MGVWARVGAGVGVGVGVDVFVRFDCFFFFQKKFVFSFQILCFSFLLLGLRSWFFFWIFRFLHFSILGFYVFS